MKGFPTDFDVPRELRQPDHVEDWPQWGEPIRGHDNLVDEVPRPLTQLGQEPRATRTSLSAIRRTVAGESFSSSASISACFVAGSEKPDENSDVAPKSSPGRQYPMVTELLENVRRQLGTGCSVPDSTYEPARLMSAPADGETQIRVETRTLPSSSSRSGDAPGVRKARRW
jgi:hypothetical protein